MIIPFSFLTSGTPPPGDARFYATLDTTLTDGSLGFSYGNLTVTTDTDGTWSHVVATVPLSSGKWYWEVEWESGSTVAFGVAKAYVGEDYELGYDDQSWGFDGTNKLFDADGDLYGSAVAGDIIGIALDMDAGSIEFYVNGVSQGVAFTGITGPVYPSVSIKNHTSQVTLNFGAPNWPGGFAFGVPSGFNEGVYVPGMELNVVNNTLVTMTINTDANNPEDNKYALPATPITVVYTPALGVRVAVKPLPNLELDKDQVATGGNVTEDNVNFTLEGA